MKTIVPVQGLYNVKQEPLFLIGKMVGLLDSRNLSIGYINNYVAKKGLSRPQVIDIIHGAMHDREVFRRSNVILDDFYKRLYNEGFDPSPDF